MSDLPTNHGHDETGANAPGDEQAQLQHPDAESGLETTPLAVRTRTGMWSTGTGDTSGYGGIVRHIEMPGTAQRPFGGWFDEVTDRMEAVIHGLKIQRITIDRGEITYYLDPACLLETVKQLRDDPYLRFEVCMSVSGVHYPQEQGRELHAVYHLLSMTHNRRIRLEVTCSEQDQHIPSVVSVYPMADFHERETYDMFGIIFDGHPHLTRILMPDDWYGHPQRKDYPLGGIPIEYKGAEVPAPDQRRKYNA